MESGQWREDQEGGIWRGGERDEAEYIAKQSDEAEEFKRKEGDQKFLQCFGFACCHLQSNFTKNNN